MVDLDKWEEIEFDDIKEGDLIRVITVGKRGDFEAVTDARGIVTGQTWGDDWSCNGINLVKKPGSKGPDFKDTFYRSKPEFEFPTKPLSIIEGTYKFSSGSNNKSRFIRTEDGGWMGTRDGGRAHAGPLRSNFKDWTVIFDGIDA